MNQLAVVVFWVLVGLVIIQAVMVVRFVGALKAGKRPHTAEAFCPKVAAVLCLRGADPFLPTCIRALLSQDYPNYDVKIVVDRREDPAWNVAQQTVAECRATNVEIQPLSSRRDSCSLKCSSLLQAVEGLDKSYDVVALLDADTVPHRSWLRELVAPLADGRVGVSTGNRWYMPVHGSWGAMVRYLWNAAAVVQMYWYRIPWGGTLAIKTKALRESGLCERWQKAFCEDTMLYQAMHEVGLGVAFVPSLMMVNREGGDIPGFFHWVRRQLLTARLYHPRWVLVLAHGIVTTAMMGLAAGLGLVAAAVGRWEAAAWAGGGLAQYLAVMPLLVLAMEWFVRQIVQLRGEPTRWLTPRTAVQLCVGVPLTQILYAVALSVAVSGRVVEWRGVCYRVEGPWKIRLLEDRPYNAVAPATDTITSL